MASRRATILTAPTLGDGLRIPRPWVGQGRAVRIWAPPPVPDPPRRGGRRWLSGPPGRCSTADGSAPAPPPPPRSVAHTVRLAGQADLPALVAIERECGNPAWGPAELQVRVGERETAGVSY